MTVLMEMTKSSREISSEVFATRPAGGGWKHSDFGHDVFVVLQTRLEEVRFPWMNRLSGDGRQRIGFGRDRIKGGEKGFGLFGGEEQFLQTSMSCCDIR